MIFIKTKYKIKNSKGVAIIKVFKTWQYYLKSCKYKVFILINQNKLGYFINIKSLNFLQI